MMTAQQPTTTGPDTQNDPFVVLSDGIRALYEIMNPPRATPASLLPQLVSSCRTLTDHLTGYAISATVLDEEAIIAVEQAERLLQQAKPVLGQLANPPVHEDDQCPDCRCFRSEAEADEGWNPDEGCCFSCVDSVYALAERFGIHGDDLDTLRAKLWEARERALKDEIEACLTFGK